MNDIVPNFVVIWTFVLLAGFLDSGLLLFWRFRRRYRFRWGWSSHGIHLRHVFDKMVRILLTESRPISQVILTIQ